METKDSTQPNTAMDERESKSYTRPKGRAVPKVSRPIVDQPQTPSPASETQIKPVEEPLKEKKVMTNQEFLESKLKNCKTFIQSIAYLKNTELERAFLKITPKEMLEWVIWMKNEGKSIESGLSEMFALHKLQVDKLKQEEFDKMKAYFNCFQTIATHNY